MQTYAIVLDRSTERADYIQKHLKDIGLNYNKISAVDGRKLTREDIEKECDIEQVDKLRYWLTDGAIGCAASHKIAYREFLNTTDETAFIIEDDVILPKNIKDILISVSKEIKSNEVILLYYISHYPAQFSKINRVALNKFSTDICFPMDVDQPITAAAYMIGRQAAEGLLKANTPIAVAADSWRHFYSKNAFESLRVLFPSPISTKNFKSSIDYLNPKSIKGILSEIINKYKVPLAYQYLNFRRNSELNKRLHFSLSEEKSPLDRSSH